MPHHLLRAAGCSQVYKEFQGLYEGKLEEFLASQQIDQWEFAVQCKQALQQVRRTFPSSTHLFIQN